MACVSNSNLAQGKDVVFQVMLTGSYKTVVVSKSLSLNTTTEVVEVTTITDGIDPTEGIWKDFDYDNLSYTISLEGILAMTSTDETVWTLVSAQTGFYDVPFKIIYKDPANNTKTITGTCLIKSIGLSATPNAYVQQNIEFQGKGKYSIA